ncbi:MAG: mechanosensitive ion channel domain-containing protein [Thiobacillaceae bacterium]|jgi:small-conductance mechanosensitive channel
MASQTEFTNLLTLLIEDSHNIPLLWQLAALALAAGLSWFLMRLVQPYLQKEEDGWESGRATLRRIGFPLLMLVCVVISREIIDIWQPEHHLLNLVAPLLVALVLIRALIYALRYVFKPSDRLKIWERFVAWSIWIGLALHITGLLPRINHALEALSFQAGGHRFSLLLLFQAATTIILAVIAALWIAQFIESRLMSLPRMDLSLRLALSKATRTILLVLAVLVALPAVGIDLTVLSVFGGALGVGLGFGLQKIASNYVSGFIILLDRSIRIGDLITVDSRYGQVAQINTRYTLLKGLDGTETIVPNEQLITNSVVNHSLSKPDVRVGLPIQVSYDTDLEQAKQIMLEVAQEHIRVTKDNPEEMPKVLLNDFGDNGINLELAFWIRDAAEGQLNLRSELNWEIWRRFNAAGIEIPFPQRDIHIKSGAQSTAIDPRLASA